MTDREFQRHPLSILQQELGVEGLARFLRVYRSGRRDYTKDRDQLLKGITIDEIVEQVRTNGATMTSNQAVDRRTQSPVLGA